MAMDTWEAGADVWEMVQHHISHNHPALALVDKEIAVIFRGKASKTGGQVVLGKSRKAGALFKVLGKHDFKFILEIAGDEWKVLSNAQQVALRQAKSTDEIVAEIRTGFEGSLKFLDSVSDELLAKEMTTSFDLAGTLGDILVQAVTSHNDEHLDDIERAVRG